MSKYGENSCAPPLFKVALTCVPSLLAIHEKLVDFENLGITGSFFQVQVLSQACRNTCQQRECVLVVQRPLSR